MQNLTFTLNSESARQVQSGGRTWLVAPMTTIVPGVLSGSKGALRYPEAEIRASEHKWDGIPITIYHPTSLGGQNVSASAHGVMDRQGVGVLKSTKVTGDGKLKHEGWFDVNRLNRVEQGKRVLEALREGRQMELSTGLYTDNVPGEGTTNDGRWYSHTARSYVPDHLAILPDQVGACSLSDGCGLNVNRRRDLTINQDSGGLLDLLSVNANPQGFNQYKKQAGFQLVEGVKSVKKAPDHEFTGTYHVTLDNGEQHSIYYDRQSQMYHHEKPKDKSVGMSMIATSKQDVLPRLVRDHNQYVANRAGPKEDGCGDGG